MKEHLNLDSVTASKGWVEPRQKNIEASKKPDIKEDTLLTTDDDLFESQVRGRAEFDDSLIDDMDFDDVLDSLSFIRQQAGTQDGRRMMSMAHNTISPKQVVQLLGA